MRDSLDGRVVVGGTARFSPMTTLYSTGSSGCQPLQAATQIGSRTFVVTV